MIREKRKSDCPINFAMELFGDRWTFLIIRDLLFKGKHYYGEFLQSDEKISTNILADRLSMLEKEKIIIKRDDPANGVKQFYELTDMGIDLVPLLIEVILWSAKYDRHTAADKKFISQVKKDKEGFTRSLMADLKARR